MKKIVDKWNKIINYKDIGTLYLIFALVAGGICIAISVLIRTELAYLGNQIFGGDYQQYDVEITGHALIFFIVMLTMSISFGNWLVPLMIGVPDMSFPRLNNLSFWLYLLLKKMIRREKWFILVSNLILFRLYNFMQKPVNKIIVNKTYINYKNTYVAKVPRKFIGDFIKERTQNIKNFDNFSIEKKWLWKWHTINESKNVDGTWDQLTAKLTTKPCVITKERVSFNEEEGFPLVDSTLIFKKPYYYINQSIGNVLELKNKVSNEIRFVNKEEGFLRYDNNREVNKFIEQVLKDKNLSFSLKALIIDGMYTNNKDIIISYLKKFYEELPIEFE